MSWVDVEVTESGDDIVMLLKHQQASLDERIRWAFEECVKEWKWIVINSTWYNPRPSPESEIIARYWKEGLDWIFEYGWRHYKGSASKAQARLELRKDIGVPMFLAFLGASFSGRR